MEVTLFASLLLLTFVALDMRRDLLAGLSFGLACIARPEGLVLIALLVPAWYLLFQPLPRPHMSFVNLTLPAALMFGCWMVYNMLVTGHLLPNTFSYPTTLTLALSRSGYPFCYIPITTNTVKVFDHRKPLFFCCAYCLLCRYPPQHRSVFFRRMFYVLCFSATTSHQQASA